jgi:phage protein D
MMTNTLEDPSPFDALAKLKPNEVYFLLLGRDPHAAKLVLQWAELERNFVREHVTNPEEARRRLLKANDAETIAWDMAAYQKGHKAESEAVAAPVEKPRSYSGHVLPAEAQARDDLQRARTLAARHLSEAAAQAQSAIEILTGIGVEDQAQEIEKVRGWLNAVRDRVLPPRPIAVQPELTLGEGDGR